MQRPVWPTLALASLLAPLTATSAQAPQPACTMESSDKAWLERASSQWRLAAQSYGRFEVPDDARAVIGSADCVLISDTALSPGKPAEWKAVIGNGKIPIIEDFAMPLSPTSQAMLVDGKPYFVMSAPSVWRKHGVSGGAIGLENLMTAVFIHEAAHILQQNSYFSQIGEFVKANDLPQGFDDDSLQEMFKTNAAYAGSVREETALLYAAADAPSLAASRRMARQALSKIKQRRASFFVGKKSKFGEIEPRRVYRRRWVVSHAAISMLSAAA